MRGSTMTVVAVVGRVVVCLLLLHTSSCAIAGAPANGSGLLGSMPSPRVSSGTGSPFQLDISPITNYPPERNIFGETRKRRRRIQEQDYTDGDGSSSKLPWGDINVVVLTDVHSWVGGHKNHDSHSATYGDVLSFIQRLRQQQQRDLWVVMNGDWIDGTGLAMNGNIQYLIPILERMTFDAVSVGNHELYRASVIQAMGQTAGFVEFLGPRYLSSNVVWAAATPAPPYQSPTPPPNHNTENSDTLRHDNHFPNQPIGNHYRILKGTNASVLTFGFLYHMTDYASDEVLVKNIQEIVQETWFVEAIQSYGQPSSSNNKKHGYDAILILAHMDVRDPLCTVLLQAIRNMLLPYNVPHMPIQFITGHTHTRDYERFDNYSTSVEAGKYLDTIGFVSFPSIQSTVSILNANPLANDIATELLQNNNVSTFNGTDNPNSSSAPTAPLFQHTFINGNVVDLAMALGFESSSSTSSSFHSSADKDDAEFEEASTFLATPDGTELSSFILRIQIELGLKQVVGCLAKNAAYHVNRTYHARDSIWRFFQENVVPALLDPNNDRTHTRLAGNAALTTRSENANKDNPVALLLGSSSWRFDLYGRDVRVDDVIAVSPFNNTLVCYKNVPAALLVDLHGRLNAMFPRWYTWMPNFLLSTAVYNSSSHTNDNGNDSVSPLDTRLYTVLVDEFEWALVQQEIDLLQNSTDTRIANAVPIAGLTTTSIWMDYFLYDDSTARLCTKSNSGSYRPDNDSPSQSTNGHNATDATLDAWRLGLVSVALLTMIVLASVAVYQKAAVFRQDMERRDFATLQAMREYGDNNDEYDEDEDNDVDPVGNRYERNYLDNDGFDADEMDGEMGEFV